MLGDVHYSSISFDISTINISFYFLIWASSSSFTSVCFNITFCCKFCQSSITITMTWEEAAADKKSRIAESIPQEWRIKTLPTEDNVMDYAKKSGILTAEEISITESSATELVEKLAAGQLKSVAVTTAFCKRAALAHQLVYLIFYFMCKQMLKFCLAQLQS